MLNPDDKQNIGVDEFMREREHQLSRQRQLLVAEVEYVKTIEMNTSISSEIMRKSSSIV